MKPKLLKITKGWRLLKSTERVRRTDMFSYRNDCAAWIEWFGANEGQTYAFCKRTYSDGFAVIRKVTRK